MVIMVVVSVQQPLVNAVNGYYLSRGKSMNFGSGESNGAFGDLRSFPGSWVWWQRFGERVIPIAICFLLVTMVAVISSFSDGER